MNEQTENKDISLQFADVAQLRATLAAITENEATNAMTLTADKDDAKPLRNRLTVAEALRLVLRLEGTKIGRGAFAFGSRPIFLNPSPGTLLPDDAIIVVSGYPFGWYGKCLKVFFYDFNKSGEGRFMHATSNYGYGWHTLKAETFHARSFVAWEFDTDGHVVQNIFDRSNATPYSGKYTFLPEVATAWQWDNKVVLNAQHEQFTAFVAWLEKKQATQLAESNSLAIAASA